MQDDHIRDFVGYGPNPPDPRWPGGARPLGWYCRYTPSVNTRRLLVEEGGFLYDSDAYNDELPYWVGVGDKPHLVIPYMLDTNDMIKFVWPNILAKGHTYELALFQDHNKNRTCAGDPGGTEAQWLFPVPAVTADFTFNFMHNPRAASCQDFPAGPIP